MKICLFSNNYETIFLADGGKALFCGKIYGIPKDNDELINLFIDKNKAFEENFLKYKNMPLDESPCFEQIEKGTYWYDGKQLIILLQYIPRHVPRDIPENKEFYRWIDGAVDDKKFFYWSKFEGFFEYQLLTEDTDLQPNTANEYPMYSLKKDTLNKIINIEISLDYKKFPFYKMFENEYKWTPLMPFVGLSRLDSYLLEIDTHDRITIINKIGALKVFKVLKNELPLRSFIYWITRYAWDLFYAKDYVGCIKLCIKEDFNVYILIAAAFHLNNIEFKYTDILVEKIIKFMGLNAFLEKEYLSFFTKNISYNFATLLSLHLDRLFLENSKLNKMDFYYEGDEWNLHYTSHKMKKKILLGMQIGKIYENNNNMYKIELAANNLKKLVRMAYSHLAETTVNYIKENVVKVSEIESFVFCPASFSIKGTYDTHLEKDVLVQRGSAFHEKLLLFKKKYKIYSVENNSFNKPNLHKKQREGAYEDLEEDMKGAKLYYAGHDKIDGQPDYFISKKKNLVGSPDYIFEKENLEKFIIEEKFSKNTNKMKNPYESHHIQLLTYLYAFESLNISYGYLIIWEYEIEGYSTNTDYIISKQIIYKIEKDFSNKKAVIKFFNLVNTLKNNTPIEFFPNEINILKCINCSVNIFCKHRNGGINKLYYPYYLDDVKM